MNAPSQQPFQRFPAWFAFSFSLHEETEKEREGLRKRSGRTVNLLQIVTRRIQVESVYWSEDLSALSFTPTAKAIGLQESKCGLTTTYSSDVIKDEF